MTSDSFSQAGGVHTSDCTNDKSCSKLQSSSSHISRVGTGSLTLTYQINTSHISRTPDTSTPDIRIPCLIQVIIGLSCIAFKDVVTDLRSKDIGSIGVGFWDGLLFIMTGIFGLATRGTNIGHVNFPLMLLCILSGVISSAMFCLGALGIALMQFDCSYNHYRNYQLEWICPDSSRLATTIFLTVLAGIEALAAIWSTVLCYRTVCSASTNTSTKPNPVSIQLLTLSQNDHVIIVTSSSPISHYTIPIADNDTKAAPSLTIYQQTSNAEVKSSRSASVHTTNSQM